MNQINERINEIETTILVEALAKNNHILEQKARGLIQGLKIGQEVLKGKIPNLNREKLTGIIMSLEQIKENMEY